MAFFDLHTHLLCGVDDGAQTEEEMLALVDLAYADGTRAICLTPHFSPYLFGDTSARSAEVFERLRELVAPRYPDLELYLGHELGYHASCVQALRGGSCRTLNNSRYLLVDFPAEVDFFEIRSAMEQLRGIGYRVVLAHPERYACLAHRFDWVEEFISDGGLIQLNALSCTGIAGGSAKKLWKKFVKNHLVHVISSDGHNLTTRQPKISVCLPYLQKYCSPEEIDDLTFGNASRIVRNEVI